MGGDYKTLFRPFALKVVTRVVSVTQSAAATAQDLVRPSTSDSQGTSSLEGRLRRFFRPRIDSVQYSTVGCGPVDPQLALQIATQFVADKEGVDVRHIATDVNVQSSPESADLEADDARSSAASTSPSQLVKLIVPVAPPAPSAGDTGSCVSSVASQVVPADHLPLGVTAPATDTVEPTDQIPDGRKSFTANVHPSSVIDHAHELCKPHKKPAQPKSKDGLDKPASDGLVVDTSVASAPQHDGKQRPLTKREQKARFQHEFIRDLMYDAVNGVGDAEKRTMYMLNRVDKLSGNQVVSFREIQFRKSDMSMTDHKWLRRFKTVQRLREHFEKKEISEDELDYIVSQLFPSRSDKLLEPTYWKVYLAEFVKDGTWCEPEFGKVLFNLQTTDEELRVGPYEFVRPTVRLVTASFLQLPLEEEVSSGRSTYSRLDALASLVCSMVYDSPDWRGMHYRDATSAFTKYFQAYELTNSGMTDKDQLPSRLRAYYRDWNFEEQRILRLGHVLLELLNRVYAGELDIMAYRLIRGTLFGVPGQPGCSFRNFEKFLYTKSADPGLEIADIPRLLIFHPELDFCCALHEERRLSGMLDEVERFEREEAVRIRDLEESKKAWAKAVGRNRFSRLFKRATKKLRRKKQKPEPDFHCSGCVPGKFCPFGDKLRHRDAITFSAYCNRIAAMDR